MKTAVVFIGQFPPPLSGFSFATERVADVLAERCQLDIVDTSGVGPRGQAFHFRRASRNLVAAAQILRLRRTHRVVYLACDGGLGIAYALMLAALTRLLGLRFYLHHHSYAYIDAPSALMAALLAISGEQTAHIILAPEMGRALADRYRRPLSALVLPNAALLPDPDERPARPGRRPILTIGLLSNLCVEKGLAIFLEILRSARRQHMPIRGVLAGPTARASDKAKIAEAVADLGGALEYRGPVYGAAKLRFYSDIDVFVFPSRYANEAQPLVIFEALERGRPVIAADRGCIRSQVAAGGQVVEAGADFVAVTLERLAAYLSHPESLRADSAAAETAIARQRATGRRVLPKLFDSPLCSIQPAGESERLSHAR